MYTLCLILSNKKYIFGQNRQKNFKKYFIIMHFNGNQLLSMICKNLLKVITFNTLYFQ